MAIAQNTLISAWYYDELGKQHPQREGASIVMGCPIWGEKYLQRFLAYELPSIMAPANAAALNNARGEFVIYADQPTYAALEHTLPIMPVFVRLIPEQVMAEVRAKPGYKYTLMTAVHNLLIRQAAQKGAGFSMGAADIVYSERYFERLLDLGKTHDAIAHLTPIVSQKSAMADLNAWRRDGVLELTAAQLGTLGWVHACGLMKSWLMNDATPDSMPSTHFLVWRGENYLRMHCPHLSPVWLSNKLCRAASLDIGDTIDAANGPMYMGGAPYVPTLADDMTLITLDDSRDLPAGKVDFAGFKRGLRAYHACMPQFAHPVMVPTLPAGDAYLSDNAIEQRMQSLLQAL